MTAIQTILKTIETARKDLEDAYSGKTKASATRARKALGTIAAAAKEGRKEVLAISKKESPGQEVDLSVFDAPPEAAEASE